MRFVLGTALLIVAAPTLVVGAERTLSDEEWQSDLRQLDAAIKETHFKPFHNLTQAEFDTRIAALAERIPELDDAGIMVAMAEIVAALGDGHTRLHLPRLYPELALAAELGHTGTPPPHHDSLRLSQLPVRFEWFDDGVFIVAATQSHTDLIGHRVTAIDGSGIEEALQQVRRVSFFENDSRARLMAPDRLALPDVLATLGVTDSATSVTLRTTGADGNEHSTQLDALAEPGETFVAGGPGELPLWLGRRDEYRWYQVLPDNDALYLQINEFEENPVIPYADFVAEVLAAARDAGVSRFVVDLRHNFGGIGSWVTPFVTGLRGSEFDEYGRLYILMGRGTFSAAQTFIHEFEELSYATFVGEPGGAKPSHYGDSRRIVLDNSGLTARASTIYWHSWLANDFRDAINPHLSAPLTSAAWFAGKDPALSAALEYTAPSSLALQIEEQFRAGNNQNALLLYQRYMSDATIADHWQQHPELLQMADRIAASGLVRQGYFMYFLADRYYPGRADVEAGLARLQALQE